MMVDLSLQNLILQVFEEEEELFYFPLTSQKDARAFVRSLHRKGLQYQDICAEIGEIENNFVSWRKGLGRPGIGNRIISMINKPLEDVLRSDGEDEEEEDRGRAVRMEGMRKKMNGRFGKVEDRVQNAWVRQLERKIHDLEERSGVMERRQDSTEDECDNVASSESQTSSLSPAELRASSESPTMTEEAKPEAVKVKQVCDIPPENIEHQALLVKEKVSEEPVSKVARNIHSNGMLEFTPAGCSEMVMLRETKTENGITEVDGELPVEMNQERRSSTDSVKSCATEESSDGASISPDSSSILENEINENYDSDLDMESVDRDSDLAGLLRKLACFKAEVSDGKGFVFVFTDCRRESGDTRIKVGASRFPNRRLEQAMHYNVDIQMVSKIPVRERRAALRDVLQRLHKSKVEGHEDWFCGNLETLLVEIKDASRKFMDCTSQC